MKRIVVLATLAIAACQPHAHSSATPAPIAGNISASRALSAGKLVTTGPISAPGRSVVVDVVNLYQFHDVNVDVNQFCGETTQFGPLQPSNLILGYGQSSLRVAKSRITGVPSASCFTGPAKTIGIAYNQLYPYLACAMAITPSAAGGYTFTKTSQGSRAQCSVVAANPYAATFSFNLTKGQTF